MIEHKSRRNKIHLSIKFCISIFVILIVFLPGPDIHAAEQYKKLARDAVSDIVDGKYDAAIEHTAKQNREDADNKLILARKHLD
jgi:hypothetical protein